MPASTPSSAKLLNRPLAALALTATAAITVAACGGTKHTANPAQNAQTAPTVQTAETTRGAINCVPHTLNRSAVLPNANLSVSPLPGSYDASPQTQISLLGAPPKSISHVTAAGSISGQHPGQLEAYSQGDGASFVPNTAFRPGEVVTVAGQIAKPDTQGGAAAPTPFSYQFTVSTPDVIPHTPPGTPAAPKPGQVLAFKTRPDLHPPTLIVTKSAPNVSPGYVMASPYAGPGQGGPAIFDNHGNLVWFHPMPKGIQSTNLHVQTYLGHQVLVWWQGYIPPEGFGQGEDVIADHNYRVVAVVHAGNGYMSDLHDFQLGPNGTAYPTIFNPVKCDLRAAGGPKKAAVTDGVYQEIDVKTGLVRREWHSLDHVNLKDSHPKPGLASYLWPYDYFHINSLDIDPGHHILISSRSTWGVYDTDMIDGRILRRMGGANSDVKLGPGTTVAYQHDVRRLPDGLISIFDNGADPAVHPQSRGIIEKLDPGTHTLSLVRVVEHPQPLSAGSQGSFQVLPNGHAFLGWGPQPYFSEFSRSGQLLFDARLPSPDSSYRGYRFQWSGTPLTKPSVAVARLGSAVSVFASWNGATKVVKWRVLAGPRPTSLSPLTVAPRTGFESAIPVSTVQPWVAVQALDRFGRALATSSATRVPRVARTPTTRGTAVAQSRPASGSLVAAQPARTAGTTHR